MVESIWLEQAVLPSFSAQKEDMHTQVLVIGGGIAGILTAWELHNRQIPYVLIEADRICHGITGNTTAKITAQHGDIYHRIYKRYGGELAGAYWQANSSAIEQYARLGKQFPCDFEYKSSYLYSAGSPRTLEKELEILNRLNIPVKYQNETPLPVPVTGAVRMDNQAQFHPLKLMAGLASGLRIYEHTRAMELADREVKTNRGTIRAEKIVCTTHFPLLNKHGFYFLKQYQHRSYVLALENAMNVEGMYLELGGKGMSFRNHGELLLVGGGGHRTGKHSEGWHQLRQWSEQYLPQSREAAHWAAQDCMTLDGIPYIGQYGKGTDTLFVATGFQKWGMTTAMVASKLLADMVEGKDNPFKTLFSPQRSILHPQLVINGVESVVNLITPTVPRCPHLGCALKWNSQEHSWDCPCHGSRFDSDGRLLDGPSTGNLPGEP